MEDGLFLKNKFYPNLSNIETLLGNKTPYPVFAFSSGKLIPREKTGPDDYTVDQGTPGDKELYRSSLGTPVLSNLIIESVTYTGDDGRERTTPRLQFDTILLTVSQSKNIVKTAIQGVPGTVKEYISLGDFEVTIQGIITAENGIYPRAEVSDLQAVLLAPVALPVSSWYLQLWDIDSLVVEKYTVPQEAGGYSSQAFSIDCTSDAPVELEALNI